MSISKKVLIIFIILIILTGLLSFVISHFVINEGFREIEEKDMEKNINMVYRNILDEEKALSSINEDWASWDDTYKFIIDRNRDYIDSNLTLSTFTNMELNLMIFADLEGNIIYEKYIDYSYNKNLDIILAVDNPDPSEISGYLSAGNSLKLGEDSRDGISGIIVVDGQVIMMSSKPIMTSDDGGPARGSLIMGKLIGKEKTSEISNKFFLEVNLLEVGNPETLKILGNEKGFPEGDLPFLVKRISGDQIAGYRVIKDTFGSPVLVLEIKDNRNIFNQGIITEILSILMVTGLLVILTTVTYLLINNIVIKRLSALSLAVKDIGERRDLSERINYRGKDELSALTVNINCMLDDLKHAQDNLKQSERKYRTLFENSLDGIYTSTIDGKYLDANQALVNMLGYDSKQELLSINIPKQLYWNENERPSLEERNKIFETTLKGKNGNRIAVEINSKVIFDSNNNPYYQGIVRDITLRKRAEEKIRLLSFHDDLTGLYNRAYFEEELKRLDTERQLPLSIIIGDVNGLKLINDAFGHMHGDLLLCKCARIFEECCRKDDIIARWGGDEFIILLPRTSEEDAGKLIDRIRERCRSEKLNDIPVSISLGISSKTDDEKQIAEAIKEAEDIMYRRKLLERKSISSSIISSLERTLWERSNEDEEHAGRIRELSIKIGYYLKLSQNNLDKLALLATLHDLGKVAIPDKILSKKGRLTKKEWEIIKRHPEIGYNIAHSSSQLMPIAEGILAHHEKWDGSGYPQGLRGEEIPLISRIIGIVDAYDVMTHNRPYSPAMEAEEAIQELKRCSGICFDPDLTEAFIDILEKEKQEGKQARDPD
ncbi:MAG: diguanylate cyclase [Actinobacteria bacterium]|nr:diguanylate cyclase [Actinomycetota bacterium]